ncbi:hypothetical protein [Marinifilum fragile]|uniref:hypothetical protein n=1 Tax=Marinifilum fragile TaxID=570161 RepID=UPI002AA611CC|nr:hypothetical protein [Marinifilum fragile]
MRLRIKSTTLTLGIIGWIQIIGGITGLGVMANLLLNTGQINGPLLLIFLIGISLFIFSIYSGKKLISDKKTNTGIILSIVNQLLQVFHWKILGYGLTYSSCIELAIGIEGLSLDFDLSAISSTFYMAINSGSEFYLKLNLIAMLLSFVLFDILKEKKKIRVEKDNTLVTDKLSVEE